MTREPAVAAPASIWYRLWGPVSAVRGAHRAELGGQRQRCVLAALLEVPSRPVPVPVMVHRVWGDAGPAQARAILATYVSRLRRALGQVADGPVGLPRRNGAYVLQCDPAQVDLHAGRMLAERARRLAAAGRDAEAAALLLDARGLWTDQPLTGLAGEWAEHTRRRMESELLDVTVEYFRLMLRMNRHATLIPELSSLTAQHPTDARLVELLMTAMHRDGRREDALAEYRRARRAMVRELGLEPAEQLQRLERAILRDDPLPPAGVVAPYPAWPRPAQLPPAAMFVGRERLLAEAVAGLRGGRQPVVITGTSGSGKSALTIRAAHDVKAAFPDGQLYANLNASGPNPRRPTAVLSQFLRALGVAPAAVPAEEAECTALYRSILADQRILVVLDDAPGPAEVEPLLPGGPRCAALVNSRRYPAGAPAGQTIHVGPMEPADAVELLARLIGRDRAAADQDATLEVCRLCGHLPLAIRVAGARLTAAPGLPLATFVTELADERRRLDLLHLGEIDVRASLASSYTRLGDQARRSLRRLSLVEAPDFTTPVLAALLDAGPAEATPALDDLVAASLVDVTGTDCAGQVRFTLHDLVRIYGRERVLAEEPEATRTEAIARVGRRWLATVESIAASSAENAFVAVHGCVTQARPPADPAAWLQAERGCLIAMIEQAARLPDVTTAWRLTGCLYEFLGTHGYHDDWRRALAAVIPAVEEGGDAVGLAAMTEGLGYLDMSRDSYATALVHLERARTLFLDARAPAGAVNCEASAAACHRILGRLELAARCAARSVDLASAFAYPLGMAHAWFELGNVRRDEGRLDEAVGCLRHALDLADRHGFATGRGLILRGLGIVHRRAGNLDRATAFLREAHDALTAAGNVIRAAYSIHELAEVRMRQGQLAEAESLLHDCLRTMTGHDERYGQALCLNALAQVRRLTGRPDRAAADLTEAVRLWQRLHLPQQRQRALRDLRELQRQPR